jgi:hypothetical protein
MILLRLDNYLVIVFYQDTGYTINTDNTDHYLCTGRKRWQALDVDYFLNAVIFLWFCTCVVLYVFSCFCVFACSLTMKRGYAKILSAVVFNFIFWWV